MNGGVYKRGDGGGKEVYILMVETSGRHMY